MTAVKDLYMGVIRAGITAHPRSLQKRIGPSEIGKPCDRWMLHKLNGDDEPERGPAWKPAIGTAMHAQLEEWFGAANRGGGDVGNTEWVTEWEVCVGQIGATSITGHSDLYHVPTGTVVDHKVVGAKQLAKYRLHGPSQQYRVQAHLYGKGFTDDGGWGPCRNVAIAFLPRDGELHQAYFWTEPYNPHIALDALARANRLDALLSIVGIERALATAPICDDQWCSWCRAEVRVMQKAGRLSLFDDGTRDETPPTMCADCGTPLPAASIRDGHRVHASCVDPQDPGEAPALRPVPATPAGVAPLINLFDKTN